MTGAVRGIALAYLRDPAAPEAERVYNQGDATGVVRVNSLRLRIRTLAGKRRPA